MFTRKLESGPEAATIGGSVPSFVIRYAERRIRSRESSQCHDRGHRSDESFCAVNSVPSAGASWWPAGCCGNDPAGYQRPCLSVLYYDFSEQAVGFIIGPGGEDQLVGQGRVSITEP